MTASDGGEVSCVCWQERQENRDAAEEKLRRERAAHAEKCRELTEQLERLRVEKREGDREIGSLRASLKGDHSCRFDCSVRRLCVCVCVCVCR